jgi:pseudaminic acid cytidylyltransferase
LFRPDELSNDYAGTIPVIKHVIEWMEDNNNYIENVCCLYATAPFIQSKIISKAYQQLKNSNSDCCFSVTSFAFPIQRAIKIVQGDKVDMFYPQHFMDRSQDLEDSYHDAGQFYWGIPQAFLDNEDIFSEKSIPVILPRYLVQDIDTLEDWHRAELMYKALDESSF